MRIILYSLLFLLSLVYSAGASHNEATKYQFERHSTLIYEQLSNNKNISKPSLHVFQTAYKGYLNLLQQEKLVQNSLLTICDFTLSSNIKRMWVIDLKNKKILFHTLVAHGQGSGEEFAATFSNLPESHQSSQGFYITGDTYQGGHGFSLKLHGIEPGYNDKAYERAIVIHGANYVSEQFCIENKRLGRSHGCPALPTDLAPKIIEKIQSGHCLFIYHTANNYLKHSSLLKKTPELSIDPFYPNNDAQSNINETPTMVYDENEICPPQTSSSNEAESVTENNIQRSIISKEEYLKLKPRDKKSGS